MYYLTNFHVNYPDAHVIIANCGGTISLSCQMESENNLSSIVRSIHPKYQFIYFFMNYQGIDHVVSFI